MADDPKHIRDFKALCRGDVTLAGLSDIEAELYGGSDRARAVLLASFVENALQAFLQLKLRPSYPVKEYRLLFGAMAPIGTFSAKILLGYAFNWFGPDTYHDLNLIRELRNGFAHSRNSFPFETPEVAEVCKRLKAPDTGGSFIPKSYLEMVPIEELPAASNKRHPRTRYLSACHTIAQRLLSNSGIVVGNMLDLP
jgi:hypothetical protein